MLTFIAIDKHRYETYDEEGRLLKPVEVHRRGLYAGELTTVRPGAGVSNKLSNNQLGIKHRSSCNRVAMNQASGRHEDW